MKRFVTYFSFFFLSLLMVGCQNITQYALSEQLVNHYLQSAASQNVQKFSAANMLDIDLSFDKLNIDIGRNEANVVELSGTAKTLITSLIGSQNADLSLELKGLPNFDQQTGAVYLKNLELVSYKLNSSLGTINTSTFLPYLNQALQLYFNENPVYVLDKSNPMERLALATSSKMSVEKGQFVFSWL
ncbi:DUF1439 domain-containing protein [Zophobihabitans entericus]|uniref:DUF1439 domain-containing protein n=1 Tax=Zophobihabitans entericus TaxID=1635327 RepID=A0A6G9IAI4_9GAMM|nr:DUF1439 domain-containing protein [Zophobihabitans entericus]QIQ20590.1 DUF1439 domain-containing protein [Zophobihabitans entericus]